MRLEYLSDEELERLIQEVEEKDLIPAPPELSDGVMGRLEAEQGRKQEFRGYCFRVVTSMAAAVALVFLLPELMRGLPVRMPDRREPVYATKEEALNDRGILTETLGGTNLFSGEDPIGIFGGNDVLRIFDEREEGRL